MELHIEMAVLSVKRYRLRALAGPPEQYASARIIGGTGIALPADVRVHVYATDHYLLNTDPA